jgi:hypothetical protein
VRHGALLPKLVDIGHALAGAQIEAFRYQLADALLNLSETSLRPAEEQASFHAYNHLRKKAPVFCETLSEIIHANTAAALQDLETGRPPAPRLDPKADNFQAMEDQILQDEVNLALEQHCADALAELNLRIAALLGRERVDTDTNPWRPQVFVQAVCQAWRNIDDERASARVMLGRLGPGCFLRLDAVYAALNAALAGKGILPDIKAVVRARRRETATATFAATTSPALLARGQRYNRVRDWLISPGKGQAAEVAQATDHLNLPDLFAAQDAVGNWQANTINVAVGPRLFGYLTRLQQQLDASAGGAAAQAALADMTAAEPAATATLLRHIRSGLPDGVLTTVDDNTIELLARVFDYLLAAEQIPAPIRHLLAHLQIPLLKAALMDRKFFINRAHPARLLVDKMVACSVGWDATRGKDDPLLLTMSQIVQRVMTEFDQKTSLFIDLCGQLDAFLADEQRNMANVLAVPISAGLRAERLHNAQQAAQVQLALRLDTGAVPQFVEAFLETQWLRILTLAYSIREKKPGMPERALSAMDDLIWSLQVKPDGEQRKQLLERLPAILANVNAWLNAIKWHEPERVRFFALLAERHAAVVRIQGTNSSARVEAEIAIVRRASERSLARARRNAPQGKPASMSPHKPGADGLCHGDWLAWQEQDGTLRTMKLAWISPGRSQFIFTGRSGSKTLLLAATEVDLALQQGRARIVALDRVVDRALDAVLGTD